MHTIVEAGHGASDPLEAPASLDPGNWDAFRALAHRMVDDLLGHLERIREQPAWRPVPQDVRARLRRPLPVRGEGERAAYEEFLRDVLPYPVGNTHPRFWGWVIGSGTPYGALADFLAAIMNSNASGLQGSPRYVEEQVIGWLAELLGYPADASGLIVSGGSMANFIGLATGLSARAGFDVNTLGLSHAPKQPVLYASNQTHFSVMKAVRLLGLGTDSLRVLPVDGDYQIDLAALERAIHDDRGSGLHPFAVVGNAGTVNTGACDDLEALADIAGRERLWFHIDGAFGAFAALVPELRSMVRGMGRADSLAFDLHKWMVAPIEAGMVLVRDADAHRRAFLASGGYVSDMPGGVGHDSLALAEKGPQLTRGFKALKVWLSLKAYGADAFADLVRRNVAQTRHLVQLVLKSPALELLAPAPLNVVNYRYVTRDLDEARLNELNRHIVVRLQEDGIAVPSHTVLNGTFAIRVCIVNHRTRLDDLDLLVTETVRLGRDLAARG